MGSNQVKPGLKPGLITRESLSWIRMTRTARQDVRRSGKKDAGHSFFLEERAQNQGKPELDTHDENCTAGR